MAGYARLRLVAFTAAATLAALVAVAAGYIATGRYDIGADAPHHPWTHALLTRLRDASIDRRAAALAVPAGLDTPVHLRQGAGNYAAMCAQCHLAPGMAPTELSRGLYPAPPDLGRTRIETTEAFWAIKHGIKGSGMPAWGRSMEDAYAWNLAAFVHRLPTLDAAAYARLVAGSGGHSHGGNETAMPASDAQDAHAPRAPHGDPASAQRAPAHVDPPGARPHHH